ncbi:unnamed protein product [Blepharisma stoltei]|uniref:Uncharacterized protein n=1 Tax=Blepharisma stoltei TaxID=1481888 RepID=A0AAU9KGE2_9CILI|nr:unnamed protein product [Blepharisma stoltei]
MLNRKVSFNIIENKAFDVLGTYKVKQVQRLKTISSEKTLRSLTPDPLLKSRASYSFNKTTRDISHMLDSQKLKQNVSDVETLHSIYRGASSSSLPTDYEEIKNYVKNNFILDSSIFLDTGSTQSGEEKTSLGLPTGRIQAKNLKYWLDTMKNKYINDYLEELYNGHSLNELKREAIENIYKACLREVIRQVSVFCLDRGNLIMEVVSVLFKIWKSKLDCQADIEIEKEKQLEEEILKLESQHSEILTKINEKLTKANTQLKAALQKVQDQEQENTNLKQVIFQLNDEINKSAGLIDPFKSYKLAGEPAVFNDVGIIIENKERKLEKAKLVSKSVQTDTTTENQTFEFNIASTGKVLQMEKLGNTLAQKIEELKNRLASLDQEISEKNAQLSELDQQVMNAKIKILNSERAEWQESNSPHKENQERLSRSESPLRPEDTIMEKIDEGLEENELKPPSRKVGRNSIFFKTPSRGSNNPKDLSPNPKKERRGTFSANVIMFNKRHTKLSIKNSPAIQILEECFKLSKQKMNSKSIFSKKMLHKVLEGIYNSLDIDKIENLHNDYLLEFIHKELVAKYAASKVADKKLIEIIASCFRYSNDPKFRVFLRLIGAGEIMSMTSFKIRTFKVIIECIHFMNNANLGIMIEDSIQKALYPKLRAIECIKEQFEKIYSRPFYLELLNRINQISVDDRINKDGLIQNDTFIEIIAEHYQKYHESVLEGIRAVAWAITGNQVSSFINKCDYILALRSLYPSRYLEIVEDQSLYSKFSFLKPESQSKTLVSLRAIEDLSLLKGIFLIEDIKKVCDVDNVSDEEMAATISKVSGLMEVFNKIGDENLASKSSYTMVSWLQKLDILTNFCLKKKGVGVLAFKIYSLESERFLSN